MIDKGIYSIDEYLYNNAITSYVQNNRCVFGWKMIYNVRVNGVLYRRVSGLDIVPGKYLELGRNHANPIRLSIGKLSKIKIERDGMTILITTMDTDSEG